jgi:hypothetical protein
MTEHDDAYQEWLQWLRQRLRREPTEADIKLAGRYADMASTDWMFRDEAEEIMAEKTDKPKRDE